MIIDDGSTDQTVSNVHDLPIKVIRHARNKGKGAAIKLAAKEASSNYTHIVTLDADAQHKAEDLPKFFKAIAEKPDSIIIGKRDFRVPNIPSSSRFGRKFSAFWMFVQTGLKISDMQSGYRAYPLALLENIKCMSNRYAFEIEVLVKAAWAGFGIAEIDIQAYYPPKNERISHFRAFMDNFRISLLNTRLTVRALLPIPFKRSALNVEGKLGLARPVYTFSHLVDKSSPKNLAKSAAWSLFISSIPVVGLNTILLLYAISWKKLDRLCALVLIPLTWPPLVPAICVLLGYRILRGSWLTEFSVRTLGHEAASRFLEWLVGSLIVAPILAILGYISIYIFAKFLLAKTDSSCGLAKASDPD